VQPRNGRSRANVVGEDANRPVASPCTKPSRGSVLNACPTAPSPASKAPFAQVMSTER
jgi:hypothetical protein